MTLRRIFRWFFIWFYSGIFRPLILVSPVLVVSPFDVFMTSSSCMLSIVQDSFAIFIWHGLNILRILNFASIGHINRSCKHFGEDSLDCILILEMMHGLFFAVRTFRLEIAIVLWETVSISSTQNTFLYASWMIWQLLIFSHMWPLLDLWYN